ncbi:NADPH-dependent aldehyde reductase Ari1p [Trichomonascus vanleenenianus]|uniref:NADPH-dependent aldehyde reductase Ari1p n=1 Tax=Trichomonascus vanleenenianus TaxID=2268995 RepID=UPI003ECA3C2D
MSKVLLTGASGFLALHILDILLDRGYQVVATIRSEKKLPLLERIAANKKGTLIVEYVADNNEPHGYDKVFQKHPDITTVIHTASPVSFATKDAVKEAIEPAVNGTVNVMKAAKEHGPQVRHIVLTSSVVSVIDLLSPEPGYAYTEKDWAKVTVEDAIAQPTPKAYFASKKYAELAAWDFLKNEKPKFTMTAVLPSYIWGRMLGDVESVDAINESNTFVYNVLKGNLPQSSFGHFVHVRDVAEIHVNAIDNPKAVNKRWFAVAGDVFGYDIVKLVSDSGNDKFKAGLSTSLDEPLDSETKLKNYIKHDASLSNSEHKQNYRSLKEAIFDTVQSFVDHGLWN